ncbi:M23 family metallopeptidase [Chryseobacterium sp. POE27]|uniref:M23 family metallopeptidase n=1 Tax=Chryseobacterium sp. POE27 TaxID=3138177 RepID=UPI0032193FFA
MESGKHFQNRKQYKSETNFFKLQYENEGEMLSGSGFSFDGDFYLFYAHLQELSKSLKKGDFVNCGFVLGKNGTSGYGSSKDPHLHFEIRNSNSGHGLSNRCHPGIFVYYKDEISMTLQEKEYHKKIAEKNWE